MASQEKFFDAIRYKNANEEFFCAILYKNKNAVERLLREYPRLAHAKHKVFENGPLHVAIENNCYAITKTLIEAGANIEDKNLFGETPLHLAAMFGSEEIEEIINLLTEKGADIHQKDNNGYTPLHYAVDSNERIVLSLLRAGANIYEKNKAEKTPLDKAKKWGYVEIIGILEAHAACAETKTDLPERMTERRLPLKGSKLS